ncbi:hypothetical protein PENSPDRAFT_435521 [Peniophora sp. CONT]|nr:hypothetical protein PENSPDRAFT_435521 [Peniophora sp. CONT]
MRLAPVLDSSMFPHINIDPSHPFASSPWLRLCSMQAQLSASNAVYRGLLHGYVTHCPRNEPSSRPAGEILITHLPHSVGILLTSVLLCIWMCSRLDPALPRWKLRFWSKAAA